MSVTRRHFLRASGLSLAMPMLPSLITPAAAAAASGIPPRMCYLYVPNGVNMHHWRPTGEDEKFDLNRSTASLESVKDKITFIEGLAHKNGFGGPDGAGDHARASATFLTGLRPRKTAGSDIRVGISADQVVAQSIGQATRLRSLELSCDGVRTSGACDSGYACAYQHNLSWSDHRTPVTPESNPRLVFERLFGDGDHGNRRSNFELRQQKQKSMLDFLRDEAQHLQKNLARTDRDKLDEYLTGLRDIESRIQKAEQYGMPADPNCPTPAGIPDKYSQHIRLLMDVMILALETDSTRVSTMMLAHDGSNRSFKEIGIGDGHHDLSHHKKDEDRLEKIARIDQFYADQFAYFLTQMNGRKLEDGSSLLDHTMVCYGSGISDGDRHNHDDLPVITAGGSALGWRNGYYKRVKDETPMSNLHLDMIRRMGVQAESFGDSTGDLS
jgi:Protein of unknown function (DUF1552)